MKKQDKTDIIDMQPYLDVPPSNPRQYVSPIPKAAEDQTALFEKLAKEKPEILKAYMGEKTLHPSMSMADPEAIDWANKTRAENIRLRNDNVVNLPSRTKLPKGIKAAGIIGALMGLASGDATAAIPILGEAESLEPSPEDAIIENPQASPELRKAALQKLMGR